MEDIKIIENKHIYLKFLEEVDSDFLEIFGLIFEMRKNENSLENIEIIFKYIRFFRGICDILNLGKISSAFEVYENKIEKVKKEKVFIDERFVHYIDEGIERMYSLILRERLMNLEK